MLQASISHSYQYIFLFTIFSTGFLLGKLVLHFLSRLLFDEGSADIILAKLSSPTRYLLGLSFFFYFLPYAALSSSLAHDYTLMVLRMVTFFFLVLSSLRFVDSLLLVIRSDFDRREKTLPVAITFFGKAAKAALISFILATAFPYFFFGYDIMGTVIKYIGLSTLSVGAVIGLAFQPVIKDIIGGVMIVMNDLFKEEDWIMINGKSSHSGRVVELSLRSTRLQGEGEALLSIPNSTFLGAMINNYGRASYVEYTLTLTPSGYSDIDLRGYLAAFQRRIDTLPYLVKNSCYITVEKLEVKKVHLICHIFFQRANSFEKAAYIHAFWKELLSLAEKEKLPIAGLTIP